jgi:haloacetate dehalogenase
VLKLAVLDVVPTGVAFRQPDLAFGLGFWLWFFLAQPYDLPERLIGADPDLLVDHLLDAWSATPGVFPEEVRAEYRRAFRDPETVHAVCEEYRAASTLDYAHDEGDRGRRRITCPVLVLWGGRGGLTTFYDDVLAIWREWADDVRGRAIDCGHFLAEESPEETYAELQAFFVT